MAPCPRESSRSRSRAPPRSTGAMSSQRKLCAATRSSARNRLKIHGARLRRSRSLDAVFSFHRSTSSSPRRRLRARRKKKPFINDTCTIRTTRSRTNQTGNIAAAASSASHVSQSDHSLTTTTYQLVDDEDEGDSISASASTSAAEALEKVNSLTSFSKKRPRRGKSKANLWTRRKGSKSRSNTQMSASSSSIPAFLIRFGPRKPGLIMEIADLEESLAQFGGLNNRPNVHIEVCAQPSSTARVGTVKEHVRKLFEEQKSISVFQETLITEFHDPFLKQNVASVSIMDSDIDGVDKKSKNVEVKNVNLLIHVYQLHADGPAVEELEGEDMAAANHWLLPSQEYHGMWESLVFDTDVKKQLLHYASTTLLFSSKNVNSNVITWNRVVLLHGPPGTGKTSLCKALAQKLCIRLSDRFRYGQLVEINSHGLFSKWFSESGKLVVKMFQKIRELIDDPEALVCILIDEVESLTVARQSSLSGNEPSDAVRVVNALLTQIDQIKRHPNVLILTTSNITGAIDLAFVDRADIKQFIGPPSASAIYKIYTSCLMELMRTGIISPPQQLLDLKTLEMMKFVHNAATKHSLRLWEIAQTSYSLSGRTLRKVPFLAHALYVQMPIVTMDVFLESMQKTVAQQFKEREDLGREL